MNQYYNPQRTRNIYDPKLSSAKGGQAFKLSRSKIDNFLECAKCFYLDRRLGIKRPPGYPFALNSAVDALLKKEFDIHRAKNKTHPMMKEYGLDLVPFEHEMMDEWRENFKGVQYHHKPTNFIITGAVDDVWVDSKGMIYVVDYKATSKDKEIKELDEDWQDGYKRQMEIYQWLLRKNGFKVSDTGYFVYCNGKTDVQAFDGKLEFDINIIPYKGTDKWINKAINRAHKCLQSDNIPETGDNCDYCSYVNAATSVI